MLRATTCVGRCVRARPRPHPTQTIIHPEPTQAHHATSTTTAAAATPDHRLLTAALELPCLLSRRDEYVGQLARAVAELGKVIN